MSVKTEMRNSNQSWIIPKDYTIPQRSEDAAPSGGLLGHDTGTKRKDLATPWGTTNSQYGKYHRLLHRDRIEQVPNQQEENTQTEEVQNNNSRNQNERGELINKSSQTFGQPAVKKAPPYTVNLPPLNPSNYMVSFPSYENRSSVIPEKTDNNNYGGGSKRGFAMNFMELQHGRLLRNMDEISGARRAKELAEGSRKGHNDTRQSQVLTLDHTLHPSEEEKVLPSKKTTDDDDNEDAFSHSIPSDSSSGPSTADSGRREPSPKPKAQKEG